MTQHKSFTMQPDLAPGADLPALTGVRALAALAVYLFHFPPCAPHLLHGVVLRFGNELHVGVNMFYVLSGFLICWRYEPRTTPAEDTTPVDWLAYAWNRAARIVPVYWLLLLITWWVLGVPPRGQALAQATLTQGFFPRWATSGIGQAWTLTVEESFYALAPLLFWVGTRYSLMWLAAAALLVGMLFTGVAGEFLLRVTLLGALPAFVFGIRLARELRKPRTSTSDAGENSPGSWSWRTYCGLGAVLSTIVAMSLLPRHGATGALYGLLLLVILPWAVASWFRGLIIERSFLSRLLSSRSMVHLGRASYVFYLLHLGVIQSAVQQFVTPGTWSALLVLTLISIALHTGFEKPAQRLLNAALASTQRHHDSATLQRAALLLVATTAVLLAMGWWLQFGPARSQSRSWALAQRAAVSLAAEQPQNIEASINEALLLWSENAQALAVRARLRMASGDLAAAASDLRQARQWAPRDTGILDLAAATARARGEYRDAREAIEQSLHVRPGNLVGWLLYGQILGDLGDLATAERTLRAVVEAAPGSVEASTALLDLLLTEGRGRDAYRELIRIERWQPRDPRLTSYRQRLRAGQANE